MTTIFCDGLCEPRNPGGYACWAWVAFDDAGTATFYDYGCLGHGAGMTNNRAEYAAVINALRFAAEQAWRDVRVRTDSQLIVRQITGEYACNVPALVPLRDEARTLGKSLGARIKWVPREENEPADALSRKAYQEARNAT